MPYKDKKKQKEYIKNYNKKYREKNKEKFKGYQRKYSNKNKEYYKNYYQENKDKHKKQMKKWREENKDKIIEGKNKYYQGHKEQIKENKKEYYQKNKDKINKKHKEYSTEYYQKIKEEENKRRKNLGLPLIGEGFKSEMELLVYVHHLFQNYEILTHHRKPLMCWGLWGLELDVYIPELKLAFEYMGIQHYKFHKFFHTNKEEFEAQQYRDRCKKRICKMQGITLIRIRFDERLSEQLVLSKLKYTTIKTNRGNLNENKKLIAM